MPSTALLQQSALARVDAGRVGHEGVAVFNDGSGLADLIERTCDVIRRIQEEGTCWCGGTVWQGQTAMRISVSSWATTDQDVERSLAVILRAAAC